MSHDIITTYTDQVQDDGKVVTLSKTLTLIPTRAHRVMASLMRLPRPAIKTYTFDRDTWPNIHRNNRDTPGVPDTYVIPRVDEIYPFNVALDVIDSNAEDAMSREPRRFGTVVIAFGDLHYVFTGGEEPWVDEGGEHHTWADLLTTPGSILVMS